jgi:hypothetical protein
LGTQYLWQIDYSRVPTTYFHPLLGLAHRLQVTRYYRRVDKVIRQKFDLTTTNRGGPRHRCRTDRLRILNFCQKTTTSRFDSGSTSLRSSPSIAGAPPLVTSAGSGAAPAAPWVSGAKPSTGTASGMVLPSASAPVNRRYVD